MSPPGTSRFFIAHAFLLLLLSFVGSTSAACTVAALNAACGDTPVGSTTAGTISEAGNCAAEPNDHDFLCCLYFTAADFGYGIDDAQAVYYCALNFVSFNFCDIPDMTDECRDYVPPRPPTDPPTATPTNPPTNRPTPAPTNRPTPTPTRAPDAGNPSPSPGTNSPGTSPSPTPAPISNTTTCFSEKATVEVLEKGQISIVDLKVGDFVFTGKGRQGGYEQVYAWGHFNPEQRSASFVQIYTADDSTNPLEATGDHLIFLHGKRNPVRVDSVKVGDVLRGQDGDALPVSKISMSFERTGLYNPLTPSGTLFVNGKAASTYVALQGTDSEYTQPIKVPHHNYVHLGLSPFRLLCTGISSKLCAPLDERGFPYYIALAVNLNRWANEQASTVQYLFFFAVLALCGLALAVETVIGAGGLGIIASTAVIGFLIIYISKMKTTLNKTNQNSQG